MIIMKFQNFKDNEIIWEIINNKKFFTFIIQFNQPVGFKNLIPIESLTEEQKSTIKIEPRSNKIGEKEIMIKTITGIKAKPISTIEVGLLDTEELPFYFVNAYPSDMQRTPDFPSNRQQKEEYEKSKEFWDNNVFVIG